MNKDIKDMTPEEIWVLTEKIEDGLGQILSCNFHVYLSADNSDACKILGVYSYEGIRMGSSLSEIQSSEEAIDFLRSKGFLIKSIECFETYSVFPDETLEHTTVHLEPIEKSNADLVKAFEAHSADPRTPYSSFDFDYPRSEGIFPEGWRRPWHI